MADGVDPQALALLRVDNSPSNGANFGKKSAISAESDDFSRVLEKQRRGDGVSDSAASRSSEAGRDLPSDGPGVADAGDEREPGTSAEAGASASEDAGEEATYASGGRESQTQAARAAGLTEGDADARSRAGTIPAVPSSLVDTRDGASALGRVGAPAASASGSSPDSKLAAAAGALAGRETSPQSNPTAKVERGNLVDAGLKGTLGGDATKGTANADLNTRGGANSSALVGSAVNPGDEVSASESGIANSKVALARDTAASLRQQELRNGAPKADTGTLGSDSLEQGSRDTAAALSRLGDGVRAEVRTPTAGQRDGLDASSNPRAQVGLDAMALGKETIGVTERAGLPEAMAALEKGVGTLARGAEGSVPAAQAASAGPAQPAGSSSTPPTSADRLPEYSLERSPLDPEFSGEVTARMKLLVRDGVREARLQLHPAELGRLQVTISTDGDQARVSFVAETAAARDAIEQSLPRLREQLEQNGLQLAQSDVGQQGMARGGAEQREDLAAADDLGQLGEQDAGIDERGDPIVGTTSSRIDTYI